MWNDNTLGSFPDSLTATWDHPITLRRAVVYRPDSADFPASGYGLRDYDVQALVAGQGQTLAAVRGNTIGKITSSLDAGHHLGSATAHQRHQRSRLQQGDRVRGLPAITCFTIGR